MNNQRSTLAHQLDCNIHQPQAIRCNLLCKQVLGAKKGNKSLKYSLTKIKKEETLTHD